jgi:hypothetical protein
MQGKSSREDKAEDRKQKAERQRAAERHRAERRGPTGGRFKTMDDRSREICVDLISLSPFFSKEYCFPGIPPS